MKLSVCLATHDEEEFIHYPLDSAYEMADEVIIVDGRSEDRTVELAKKYGDKVHVYHEDNPQMFHINKQKAIEKAKGEWILQLDADEALSDGLKTEITQTISNYQDGDPVAYWIPRKNYFLGRFLEKGGIYPDSTIRLYRNGAAKFPCKSVHENVEVKGKTGTLKQDLLHYADPDFSRYLKRWDRYTSMDVTMLLKDKAHPGFFDYFFVKPAVTFCSIYLRHKGFQDKFPGFVWALFSAIRNWVIYIKWWSSMEQ